MAGELRGMLIGCPTSSADGERGEVGLLRTYDVSESEAVASPSSEEDGRDGTLLLSVDFTSCVGNL